MSDDEYRKVPPYSLPPGVYVNDYGSDNETRASLAAKALPAYLKALSPRTLLGLLREWLASMPKGSVGSDGSSDEGQEGDTVGDD